MLGVLGFFVAAVIFSLVAYTSLNANIGKSKFNVSAYSFAHVLAAIAFMLWGFILAFDALDMLKTSVIVGDTLLVIASILLVAAVTKNRNFLIGASVVGIGFIVTRIFIEPQPFIEESILIFNSQRYISIILAIIFLATWLRANLLFGKALVAANEFIKDYWLVWYFTNLVAIIGFCGFIIAKKPQTVALSFGILCFAYAAMALMIALNGKGVLKNG